MLLSQSRIARFIKLSILAIAISGQATTLLSDVAKDSKTIQEQIQALQAEITGLPKESLNLTPWTLGYRSQAFDHPNVDISIEMHFGSAFSIDLMDFSVDLILIRENNTSKEKL